MRQIRTLVLLPLLVSGCSGFSVGSPGGIPIGSGGTARSDPSQIAYLLVENRTQERLYIEVLDDSVASRGVMGSVPAGGRRWFEVRMERPGVVTVSARVAPDSDGAGETTRQTRSVRMFPGGEAHVSFP